MNKSDSHFLVFSRPLAIFFLAVFLSACARTTSVEKHGAGSISEVQEVQPKEPLERPKFTIPLGEHMRFSIRWFGFEVGTADVRVKEIIKVKDRDTFHIIVSVKSNRLIDLLWPVRDEHHSFVDTENLHSLRYEKKISEGPYRADEVMEYDQENHTARYRSRKNGTIKEMLIPKDVQDQLSCTFWFRIQDMKPGDSIFIPVDADEKNWNLEVKVQNVEELNIDGFGKIKAIKAEPFAHFQGLFVRRGRVWGWMSADDRRIPLLMKAKVPKLGTINMVIVEYELGNSHIKA